MKLTNTLYKFLLVLIIGFFTILLSGISLGFMTGGVLLLKYNFQRNKENKLNQSV